MYTVNLNIKELQIQIKQNLDLKFFIRKQKWHISHVERIQNGDNHCIPLKIDFCFQMPLEDPTFDIQVGLLRGLDQRPKFIGKLKIDLAKYTVGVFSQIRSKMLECVEVQNQISLTILYKFQELQQTGEDEDELQSIQSLELIQNIHDKERQIQHQKNKSSWLIETIKQLKLEGQAIKHQLDKQIEKNNSVSKEKSLTIKLSSIQTERINNKRVIQTKKFAQILNIIDQSGDQELCNRIFELIQKLDSHHD